MYVNSVMCFSKLSSALKEELLIASIQDWHLFVPVLVSSWFLAGKD